MKNYKLKSQLGGSFETLKSTCGHNFTIIYDNKNLYGIGSNEHNQMGTDTKLNIDTFFKLQLKLDDDENIIKVITGFNHTVILTNKRLVGSGDNRIGQLTSSHENITKFTELVDITSLSSPIADITCSSFCTIIILNNNKILFAGDNFNRDIVSEHITKTTPYPNFSELVHNITEKILSVSVSNNHMIVITQDHVFSVGDNQYGQLGIGNLKSHQIFTSIPNNINIIKGYTGFDSSYLLTNSGKLLACGNNNFRQLGLNTREKYVFTYRGVELPPITDFVSTGQYFACYTGNKLYVAGENTYGQLGAINNSDIITHTMDKNIINISVSASHIIIITSNAVYACGNDMKNQIGTSDDMVTNIININFDPDIIPNLGSSIVKLSSDEIYLPTNISSQLHSNTSLTVLINNIDLQIAYTDTTIYLANGDIGSHNHLNSFVPSNLDSYTPFITKSDMPNKILKVISHMTASYNKNYYMLVILSSNETDATNLSIIGNISNKNGHSFDFKQMSYIHQFIYKHTNTEEFTDSITDIISINSELFITTTKSLYQLNITDSINATKKHDITDKQVISSSSCIIIYSANSICAYGKSINNVGIIATDANAQNKWTNVEKYDFTYLLLPDTSEIIQVQLSSTGILVHNTIGLWYAGSLKHIVNLSSNVSDMYARLVLLFPIKNIFLYDDGFVVTKTDNKIMTLSDPYKINTLMGLYHSNITGNILKVNSFENIGVIIHTSDKTYFKKSNTDTPSIIGTHNASTNYFVPISTDKINSKKMLVHMSSDATLIYTNNSLTMYSTIYTTQEFTCFSPIQKSPVSVSQIGRALAHSTSFNIYTIKFEDMVPQLIFSGYNYSVYKPYIIFIYKNTLYCSEHTPVPHIRITGKFDKYESHELYKAVIPNYNLYDDIIEIINCKNALYFVHSNKKIFVVQHNNSFHIDELKTNLLIDAHNYITNVTYYSYSLNRICFLTCDNRIILIGGPLPYLNIEYTKFINSHDVLKNVCELDYKNMCDPNTILNPTKVWMSEHNMFILSNNNIYMIGSNTVFENGYSCEYFIDNSLKTKWISTFKKFSSIHDNHIIPNEILNMYSYNQCIIIHYKQKCYIAGKYKPFGTSAKLFTTAKFFTTTPLTDFHYSPAAYNIILKVKNHTLCHGVNNKSLLGYNDGILNNAKPLLFDYTSNETDVPYETVLQFNDAFSMDTYEITSFERDLSAIVKVLFTMSELNDCSIYDTSANKAQTILVGGKAIESILDFNDIREINDVHLSKLVPTNAPEFLHDLKQQSIQTFLSSFDYDIHYKFPNKTTDVLPNYISTLQQQGIRTAEKLNSKYQIIKDYFRSFLLKHKLTEKPIPFSSMYVASTITSRIYMSVINELGKELRIIVVDLGYDDLLPDHKGIITPHFKGDGKILVQSFYDLYTTAFVLSKKENYKKSQQNLIKFVLMTYLFLNDMLDVTYYSYGIYSEINEYTDKFNKFINDNFTEIIKTLDLVPIRISPVGLTKYEIASIAPRECYYMGKGGIEPNITDFTSRMTKENITKIYNFKKDKYILSNSKMPNTQIDEHILKAYREALKIIDNKFGSTVMSYTSHDFMSKPIYNAIYLNKEQNVFETCIGNTVLAHSLNNFIETIREMKNANDPNLHAKSDFIVYSGARYFALGNLKKFDYRGFRKDNIVMLKEPVSTSLLFSIAQSFLKGECCLYKFKLPSRSDYIMLSKYSSFQNEEEILLPFGSMLKITGVKTVYFSGIMNESIDSTSQSQCLQRAIMIEGEYLGMPDSINSAKDFINTFKNLYKLNDTSELSADNIYDLLRYTSVN